MGVQSLDQEDPAEEGNLKSQMGYSKSCREKRTPLSGLGNTSKRFLYRALDRANKDSLLTIFV